MTEKRKIRNITAVFIGVLVLVSGLITANGFLLGQPDIDARQSEKELEIMKSVISTAINMTKKRLQEERIEDGEEEDSRYQRRLLDFDENVIDGYYLHGQGVVFTVPFPCKSVGLALNLERELARLDEANMEKAFDIEEMEQELEMLVTEVELQRQELGLSHSVPPPPPPPAPEAPAVPELSEPELSEAEADRREALENARENMGKAVAKIRVRLKEAEEQSERLKEISLAEKVAIKQELINVLATHGGSLTQVKNDEYINLVLNENCEFFGWRNRESARTVLSVRKADIIAHITGQISLDQFKSKIIEY
jgi:hypothetical protein